VFKRYILFKRIPKPPSIIATADEAYGDEKLKGKA
jgi:hypothetical protein